MEGKVIADSRVENMVRVRTTDGRVMEITGLEERTDEDQGTYLGWCGGRRVTFVDREDGCEVYEAQ